MCETKVVSNGKILLENVIRVKIEKDRVFFFDILGNSCEIKGKILEVDLVEHTITLEVFQ
ncbi:MAG: CooT family nickel-binding protein [Archaeoglobaceae archaeon]|nr:CooT family nickel-binding protein [Archaeoglobaceae archaeon]MDW7990280.1 CooT family nickel-binding protein [Archaeoglobaceae archaeon]